MIHKPVTVYRDDVAVMDVLERIKPGYLADRVAAGSVVIVDSEDRKFS